MVLEVENGWGTKESNGMDLENGAGAVCQII